MTMRMYGVGHFIPQIHEDPTKCVSPLEDGRRQCSRNRGYGRHKEFCKQHDGLHTRPRCDEVVPLRRGRGTRFCNHSPMKGSTRCFQHR